MPATLEACVGMRYEGRACCWLFVRDVYQHFLGIALPYEDVNLLPRTDWESLLREGETQWVKVDPPRRYDAVLLRFPRLFHIGVHCGDGTFVHCLRPESGVVRSPMAKVARSLIGCYAHAART